MLLFKVSFFNADSLNRDYNCRQTTVSDKLNVGLVIICFTRIHQLSKFTYFPCKKIHFLFILFYYLLYWFYCIENWEFWYIFIYLCIYLFMYLFIDWFTDSLIYLLIDFKYIGRWRRNVNAKNDHPSSHTSKTGLIETWWIRYYAIANVAMCIFLSFCFPP